uniref:Uncharacterized protein LOC102807477 n=1 Tax=Saccoglossus kowalevskii TaxID=10224 RepID=A0ABM0M4J0_SACKO|nr:PREDICTED: uncharacterized protein LOC102807477 [Saccoglossus kowalevskii]
MHLKVHVNLKNLIGKFPCHLCGDRFSTANYLDLHVKKHTGSLWECIKCNMVFTNRKTLDTHKDMCIKLLCKVCNKFYSKGHVKDHMQTHCRPLWKCIKCRSNFTSQNELDSHVLLCNRSAILCKECGQFCSPIGEHVKSNCGNMWKCERCKNSFTECGEFAKDVCSKPSMALCEEYGKYYTERWTGGHMKSHTKDVRECEKYGEELARTDVPQHTTSRCKKRLKDDKRPRIADEPYKCENSFVASICCGIHQGIQMRRLDTQCMTCGLRFENRVELQKHNKWHTLQQQTRVLVNKIDLDNVRCNKLCIKFYPCKSKCDRIFEDENIAMARNHVCKRIAVELIGKDNNPQNGDIRGETNALHSKDDSGTNEAQNLHVEKMALQSVHQSIDRVNSRHQMSGDFSKAETQTGNHILHSEQHGIGHSSNEQHVIGQSSNEQHVIGQSSNEQHVIGHSSNEQHSIGHSSNKQHAIGHSSNEQHVIGNSSNEQHVICHSSNEQHGIGHSSNEQHAIGHSSNEQHVIGHSSNEQHVIGHSSNEQHSIGHSSNEQHAIGHSSNEQHVIGHSSNEQHAIDHSSNEHAIGHSSNEQHVIGHSSNEQHVIGHSSNEQHVIGHLSNEYHSIGHSSNEQHAIGHSSNEQHVICHSSNEQHAIGHSSNEQHTIDHSSNEHAIGHSSNEHAIGHSSNEQHAIGHSSNEQHAISHSSNEQHGIGHSSNEQHVIGQSSNEQHADVDLSNEQHVDDHLNNEQHINVHSSNEHVDDCLSNEIPVDHLGNEQYVDDHLSNEHYVNDHLINEQHVDDYLGNEQHVDNCLINEQHINDHLGNEQHIDDHLSNAQHVDDRLNNEQHVNDHLGKEQHVDDHLGNEQHVDDHLGNEQHVDDRLNNERHVDDRLGNEQYVDDHLNNEQHVDHLGNEQHVDDHLGNEQHVDDHLGNEQHVDDHLNNGQHVDHLGNEQHVDDHLGNEQHVDDHSGNEQHVDDHLGNEQHVDDHLGNEQHVDDHLGNEQHVDDHLNNEQHVDDHLSNEQHVDDHLGNEQHVDDHLGNEQHVNDHLNNEQHVDDHLGNEQHVDDHLGNEQHVDDHLGNEQHVDDHLGNEQHVDDHLGNEQHVDYHLGNEQHVDDHLNNEQHVDDHLGNEQHVDDHLNNEQHVDDHLSNENPVDHLSNEQYVDDRLGNEHVDFLSNEHVDDHLRNEQHVDDHLGNEHVDFSSNEHVDDHLSNEQHVDDRLDNEHERNQHFYNFPTTVNDKSHLISPERPITDELYICTQCREVFTTKTLMEIHCKEHQIQDTSTGEHQCQLCGERFDTEVYLHHHMKNHTGELWECERCTTIFTNPGALDEHREKSRCLKKRREIDLPRAQTAEKSFKCDVCGVSFINSLALYNHRTIHMTDLYTKNNYVDKQRQKQPMKSCNKFVELKKHASPQLLELLECTQCEEKYLKQGWLDLHMKRHTGELYKCKKCDKVFTNKHTATIQNHYCRRNCTKEGNTKRTSDGLLKIAERSNKKKVLDNPSSTEENASEHGKQMKIMTDEHATDRLTFEGRKSADEETDSADDLIVKDKKFRFRNKTGEPARPSVNELVNCSTKFLRESTLDEHVKVHIESIKINENGLGSSNHKSAKTPNAGKPYLSDESHGKFGAAWNHREINTNKQSNVKNCIRNTNQKCSSLSSNRFVQQKRRAISSWRFGTFKCTECGEIYSTQIWLDLHMKKHTGELHACQKCGKLFTNEKASTIQGHKCHRNYTKHANRKILNDDGSSRVDDYSNQLQSCKKSGSNYGITLRINNKSLSSLRTCIAEKTYKCDKCLKRFETIRAAWDHQRAIHSLRHIKRKRCIKKPTKQQHAKKLKRKVEWTKPDESSQLLEMFECKECGEKYSKQIGLDLHMRKHTGKLYKCKQCDKVFTDEHTVMMHHQRHQIFNESNPEQIASSGSSAQQTVGIQDNIGKEINVNHNRNEQIPDGRKEKRSECDIINTFNSEEQVRQQTIHETAEKLFKTHGNSTYDKTMKHFSCDKQQASNIPVSTNVQHDIQGCVSVNFQSQRNERDAKPEYTCTVCNITFPQQHSLEEHAQVHTIAQVHTMHVIHCDKCGQSLDNYNYFNHMKTHTGETPYKCEECGMQFAWTVHLSEHMSERHPDRQDYGFIYCPPQTRRTEVQRPGLIGNSIQLQRFENSKNKIITKNVLK